MPGATRSIMIYRGVSREIIWGTFFSPGLFRGGRGFQPLFKRA